jgi:hypothetical protein
MYRALVQGAMHPAFVAWFPIDPAARTIANRPWDCNPDSFGACVGFGII